MYLSDTPDPDEIAAMIAAIQAGMSKGDYPHPWQQITVGDRTCLCIRLSDALDYLNGNPVHAGMLAQFRCRNPIKLGRWLKALNLVAAERDWRIDGRRYGHFRAIDMDRLSDISHG